MNSPDKEKRPVQRSQPEPAHHTGRFSGTIHLRSIARCYPSSRTNVIARQSLHSGGRFAFRHTQPRLPGSAAPTLAGSFRPGCPARRPQPADLRHPSRLVCLPSTSPTRPFPGFPVPTPRAANDPPPTPLPPREPGWFLERSHSPKESTTRSRPFLGPRLTCACRCVAYFAPGVFPGQAVIFNSQGYPPRQPTIPRSFRFVHRPCTGLCTCSRQAPGDSTCGLVDDPMVSGHNHRHDVAAPSPARGLHHHHSLAHVVIHVRLQPSFGAALSFLGRHRHEH